MMSKKFWNLKDLRESGQQKGRELALRTLQRVAQVYSPTR
jgi:hypothetical protein